MKLFGTMKINELGHLEIGGCDSVDLVKEYGTPLYIMDEKLIRDRCRFYNTNFRSKDIETETIYAGKAFLTLAMCKLIEEEKLSLDVVSGGELYTALKAGFPVDRIYMHGNNKIREELTMAIEAGIGSIIVDNRNELYLIEDICQSLDKKVNIFLRVNPGIEAHTHEYIKTTSNGSKFGESIFSQDIMDIMNQIANSEYINFRGFHTHIGSQILQEESYYETVAIMLKFVKDVTDRCGIISEELNLGGGFGVYYSGKDTPMDLKQVLKNMLTMIDEKSQELGIKKPKVLIEPGRSIVANAGTTLYSVGSTKRTLGDKHYIFVDGSMNDNMRTPLYDAEYEAAIANRMNDKAHDNYTITGRCCESGDIIVKDIALPHPNIGDIIAVSTTGAYNYTMSSNYNRLPKPPVIFVNDGNSRCVVKRETYEDIIRNDLI